MMCYKNRDSAIAINTAVSVGFCLVPLIWTLSNNGDWVTPLLAAWVAFVCLLSLVYSLAFPHELFYKQRAIDCDCEHCQVFG